MALNIPAPSNRPSAATVNTGFIILTLPGADGALIDCTRQRSHRATNYKRHTAGVYPPFRGVTWLAAATPKPELDYDVNRRAAAAIQGLARKLNLLEDKVDDIADQLPSRARTQWTSGTGIPARHLAPRAQHRKQSQ
jgi:hypothetical protein